MTPANPDADWKPAIPGVFLLLKNVSRSGILRRFFVEKLLANRLNMRQIFRPRLMILVTMIALSITLLLYFIEQATPSVARQFASRLETASEQEVQEIVEQLGRLGPAGIAELAQGLSSTRRVVVLGTKNVLDQEFQKWTQQEIRKSVRSHHLLAKSLAENLERFGPTSRLIAASFAQRILRTLLAVPSHDRIAKRFETIQFCEEILQKTEGERSVAGYPQRLNEMHTIARSGEPQRLYPPDPFDEQLILAANERHRSIMPDRFRHGTSERNNGETEFYDPYSSHHADLLYAVYQSRLNSAREQSPPQQIESTLQPHQVEESVVARVSGLERLAYRNVQGYRLLLGNSETVQKSQVAERIASQFSLDQENGEDERLPHLSALPKELYDRETTPKVAVENTELGKTPMEEIFHLPTSDLIRLLQHPNRSTSAVAEKRLRDRDGFQDEHIALAYRLHHPDTELRKGMIDALVRVPSIHPVPWLMEMLRDGNPEVRLVAVTFVATAKDKSLFQEVLNQARNDDDPRINGLIQKLERIQRL